MTAADIRRHAAELVALAPDVILAHGAVTVGPLLQATRTVPIVFPVAGDPVAAGLVDSLARPGGNATGFLSFEYSLSGKWPELLREVAPSVRRAAVIRDATNPSGIGQFGVIQAVAPSVGLEVFPVNLRDAADIEPALATLASSRDGGLIVTSSGRASFLLTHIIKLAVQPKLPAVCPYRYMITGGGLISYGPDLVDKHPARGRLRGSYPQRREPRRHAGSGADQVRAGHQPQDREGSRPHRAR